MSSKSVFRERIIHSCSFLNKLNMLCYKNWYKSTGEPLFFNRKLLLVFIMKKSQMFGCERRSEMLHQRKWRSVQSLQLEWSKGGRQRPSHANSGLWLWQKIEWQLLMAVWIFDGLCGSDQNLKDYYIKWFSAPVNGMSVPSIRLWELAILLSLTSFFASCA